MRHVVMYSGGIGSWAAARRVVSEFGSENVTLLFTDTGIEDGDLYRFIDETAALLGANLVKISDGRTPWELFNDEGFIGNTRVDLCSRVLKRDLADRWLKENCDPEKTVVYLGIDWTEAHRFKGENERGAFYRYRRNGWVCRAPMCEEPLIGKSDMMRAAASFGIRLPRLYGMGFPHNNCGGFCVKAGQAHFKLLLEQMPDRYREHEESEASFREKTGKDVSILRDRRGGKTKPLTLRDFRLRVIPDGQHDLFEWGGCGCFMGDDQ